MPVEIAVYSMLHAAKPEAPGLLSADVDVSMLHTSAASLQGTASPDLQPPAFKEALRNGGKLWHQIAHYLAALGQTTLLQQRFESEVRIACR